MKSTCYNNKNIEKNYLENFRFHMFLCCISSKMCKYILHVFLHFGFRLIRTTTTTKKSASFSSVCVCICVRVSQQCGRCNWFMSGWARKICACICGGMFFFRFGSFRYRDLLPECVPAKINKTRQAIYYPFRSILFHIGAEKMATER